MNLVEFSLMNTVNLLIVGLSYLDGTVVSQRAVVVKMADTLSSDSGKKDGKPYTMSAMAGLAAGMLMAGAALTLIFLFLSKRFRFFRWQFLFLAFVLWVDFGLVFPNFSSQLVYISSQERSTARFKTSIGLFEFSTNPSPPLPRPYPSFFLGLSSPNYPRKIQKENCGNILIQLHPHQNTALIKPKVTVLKWHLRLKKPATKFSLLFKGTETGPCARSCQKCLLMSVLKRFLPGNPVRNLCFRVMAFRQLYDHFIPPPPLAQWLETLSHMSELYCEQFREKNAMRQKWSKVSVDLCVETLSAWESRVKLMLQSQGLQTKHLKEFFLSFRVKKTE